MHVRSIMQGNRADILGARDALTRRDALRRAGIVAGAGMLSMHGIGRAMAQESTPAGAAGVEVYPELVVTAVEYAFAMPESTPAGLTRLTMQNDGAEDHHAMFMRLHDDADFAALEAAMSEPDLGQIFALADSVGGPVVASGLQASVIADLEPGQYMVICVIPDAEGMPHYMMGMYAPLEVTAAEGETAPPATDTTVELVDFAFEMPTMEFTAGQHIWDVPNVGEYMHELVVLRLAEGVTADQLQPVLDAMAPAATPEGAVAGEASPEAAMSGPPPFTAIGGVAPMSPGYANWTVLDLEAGEYLAICFVPDPATGQPHFALGMLMPLSVV
jgi:hypothetical protein